VGASILNSRGTSTEVNIWADLLRVSGTCPCVRRLEVMDESAQHAGHAGARETDSPSGETHFRVELVSPEFEGLPTIKRHRLVYQVGAHHSLWNRRRYAEIAWVAQKRRCW